MNVYTCNKRFASIRAYVNISKRTSHYNRQTYVEYLCTMYADYALLCCTHIDVTLQFVSFTDINTDFM